MSGGRFDYRQYQIEDIADEMEKLIGAEYLTDEVDEKIREGVSLLRRAYAYVQRIDYLVEGDDGIDTFFVRLKEDLAGIDRAEYEAKKLREVK